MIETGQKEEKEKGEGEKGREEDRDCVQLREIQNIYMIVGIVGQKEEKEKGRQKIETGQVQGRERQNIYDCRVEEGEREREGRKREVKEKERGISKAIKCILFEDNLFFPKER